MKQIELEATTREIVGKKVRFLRRQGITPVHLFGHSVESMALQCDTVQLQHVLAQAGRTRLINLRLDEGEQPRSVLVREVQRDSRTGRLIHVDFYQVILAEKVKLEVPIVLVGEAPALKYKGNMLMQELNSLAIECLPDGIPPSVELNLSPLTDREQVIRVKEIEIGEGITVLDDPENVVVRIIAPTVEKVEVEEKAAPVPEAESEEE
jgi:large subunit ribosomal protein L25